MDDLLTGRWIITNRPDWGFALAHMSIQSRCAPPLVQAYPPCASKGRAEKLGFLSNDSPIDRRLRWKLIV